MVLVLLCACGSGSSGSSGPIAPSSSAGAANPASISQPTPLSPTWIHPKAGNASPSSSSSNPPSTNAPSSSSGNSNPSGSASSNSSLTGPQLFGSIPPDPETGFNGQLYFAGEKIVPGSSILVSYQGQAIKTLPANFYSSELLSSYVFLTIPGDYRFEALAPDGSISGGFDLKIPMGATPGLFNGVDPAIHMTFPTKLQQGFVGTVYLMGDHFTSGAQLLVQSPNLPPITMPLTMINRRTLAWSIATPFSGTVTIQVINPDLRTSLPLRIDVPGVTLNSSGSLPRPSISGIPTQLTAPFVGGIHIYGQDFLPGAMIEVTDLSNQQVSLLPTVFLSNSELLWTLVYPSLGAYELKVVNPDNQSSSVFTLDIQ